MANRLAILAGEPQPSSEITVSSLGDIELPHYFDLQAQKAKELAAARQEVLEKRLNNFQPTYPLPELQSEAKPTVLVGVHKGSFVWMGWQYDPKTYTLTEYELPDGVRELLDEQKYAAVIESGHNILTFAPHENIDIHTLLFEALEKHMQKYGLVPEDE